MLEHLLLADPKKFLPHEDASPGEVLTAQYTSSLFDGLDVLPDDAVLSEAQASLARSAFLAMTAGQSEEAQKLALTKLEVPDAVKQMVGMLSAYDWAFVEQAKELRGYTVHKILEDTLHPEARYRLKALEMLGKVTEVALFTERHEVKKVGMSDSELDEELKRRLARYAELSAPEEKEVQAIEEEEQACQRR